jgi:Uma2 family endonuclease
MHMALSTHRWTRADLERMPDDGNRYEVIHGELLVSPAPRPVHDLLIHRLRRLLEPYCDQHGLGIIGSVQAFVTEDSETIPDLVVRHLPVPPPDEWDDAPMPLLVVEVLSDSTRRNDEVKKRAFYIEARIPEYWIVDGQARRIRVITSSGDRTESEAVQWSPRGASEPLTIDVQALFSTAIGPASG